MDFVGHQLGEDTSVHVLLKDFYFFIVNVSWLLLNVFIELADVTMYFFLFSLLTWYITWIGWTLMSNQPHIPGLNPIW